MESLTLKYTFDDDDSTRMSKLFDGMMADAKTPSTSTNSTFFIDSDLDETESETGESYDEPSPVESVESLGHQSASTVSPAAPLDDSAAEPGRNLIFRLKSVKGRPSQDAAHLHLFRASLASTQDWAWPAHQPDDPSVEPVPEIPAPLKPLPRPSATDKPLPDVFAPADDSRDPSDDAETDIRQWSTQQVAAWMFNSGFESAVISSFLTHDVNGAILVDLRFEDLRELDVVSYGKRVQIWNELSALLADGTAPDPLSTASGSRMDRSCSQVDVDLMPRQSRKRSNAPHPSPSDRAAAAAAAAAPPPRPAAHVSHLRQDVPKPHRCSKGKKCPKWRRQQDLITEVDRQHGPMTPPSTLADRPFSFVPRSPLVDEAMLGAPDDRGRAADKALADNDDEALLRQLQLPQSPTRVKQYLQLQHIVQQTHELPLGTHPAMQQQQQDPVISPVSPLTPMTPMGDIFAAQPPQPASQSRQPAEFFPPRFSSLNSLPKLEIPPPARPKTPTRHTPSSSDSTIHPLKRDDSPTPVDSHSRSSSMPPTRGFAPAVTGLRPSVSRAVTAKAPPPPPPVESPVKRTLTGQRLRSPASESDLKGNLGSNAPAPEVPSGSTAGPGAPPAPNTKGLRPALRSSASDANLLRKRNAAPLPTLRERGNKVEYDKSLPPTPAKSTSSAESVVPPLPKFLPTGVTMPKTEGESVARAVSDKERAEKEKIERASAVNSSAGAPQQARTRTPTPTSGHPPRAKTPVHAPAQQLPERKSSVANLAERKGSAIPDERKPSIVVPPTPGQGMNVVYPLEAYGDDIIRVGWARRRKSRLWRHEWSAAHLRLTSTTLGVYATSRPDDGNPLELIDMDEYTIACSTGSGTGKLAAAVRTLRLGAGPSSGRSQSPGSGNLDGEHGAAFAWQLVPKAAVGETHNANIKSVRTEKDRDGEEKTVIVGSRDEAKVLKTHNFAVLTRDERIEWMRQVMLAQALRAKLLGNKKPDNKSPRGSGDEGAPAPGVDNIVVKGAEIKTNGTREALESLIL